MSEQLLNHQDDEANRPNVVPDPGHQAEDTVEYASEDLLIPRPDLGPGCHTVVVAGEAVPEAVRKQRRNVPTEPEPSKAAASKASRSRP
ncbi:hypothetical protein [Streptomyces hirsutus]|uniref:hypothetical protein n=1 Tax=Streptomyces hirsutus TaxID=35620 RepID=UPI0036938DC0